jgi:hypothetical protein
LLFSVIPSGDARSASQRGIAADDFAEVVTNAALRFARVTSANERNA